MTDEELIEISDETCLQVLRAYLDNDLAVPDFTEMPARYQLRVLKWFIDTALSMKAEDVADHCDLEAHEVLIAYNRKQPNDNAGWVRIDEKKDKFGRRITTAGDKILEAWSHT